MPEPVLDLNKPHRTMIGRAPERYSQVIDGKRCYFKPNGTFVRDEPVDEEGLKVAEAKNNRRRSALPKRTKTTVVGKGKDPREDANILAPRATEPEFVEPDI